MTMESIFLILLLPYLLLLFAVSFWATKQTTSIQEYLVAGRRLPVFLAVPTLVATWFGAGSCIGVTSMVYQGGFGAVLSDPFGCTLAMIIAGFFFAAPFWRSRCMTISDLLGEHYGKQIETFASFLMLPFFVGTLSAQMVAMGYLLQYVLGIPNEMGIVIGSVIVIAYTVCGGMWAVTLTDFIQFTVLALGLLFFLPYLFESENLSEQLFKELPSLLPKSGSTLSYLGQILLTGCGAIMGQDLLQRFASCENASTARKSAFLAALFYLFLASIPLLLGLAAKNSFSKVPEPNELLFLLAGKLFNPAMFAIFSAGLISAIMSTADSYLLAGSSLLSRNILLRYFSFSSEKAELSAMRLGSICLSSLSLVLALYVQSIYALMVHSGAMLFVAIFVPVLLALFKNERRPMIAWLSMLSGIAAWALYLIFTSTHEENLYAAAAVGGFASLLAPLLYKASVSMRIKEPPPIIWIIAALFSLRFIAHLRSG